MTFYLRESSLNLSDATPLQNINWNRLEMREFANILAFYYLAAFFHVGIGQCAKLPMFHNSGTEDFYNPGQTKIWLGHEEVQNLLKVSISLEEILIFSLFFQGANRGK
jgi:hypothetical protein